MDPDVMGEVYLSMYLKAQALANQFGNPRRSQLRWELMHWEDYLESVEALELLIEDMTRELYDGEL